MSTRRNSATDKRQKSQYRLAFPEESRGAAPTASEEGTESELAKRTAESPATEQWVGEVCERENCKQALRRVKANKGSPGIDGMTVEKFFDRVNHDRLLAKIAERVSDKRLLKLIRAFLRAGVMENGLVSPTEEGTPQGGALSPALSNIVLNELDQELERRGHRFTRYADDCNTYVRSRRAGERVMRSVTRLLTTKLKLRVNSEKSGGTTMGTEIPGIQLHESQATEEALGAESSRAIQGTSSGTHKPDTGHKPRPNGP
jgi:hypothetical protein